MGHKQAAVVAKQIAKDVGAMPADEADKPFWPEIVCIGDMEHHKGFFMYSDVWYGGKTSILKMGYTYYALKLAFKEVFFRTGGKLLYWGLPLVEFMAEKVA